MAAGDKKEFVGIVGGGVMGRGITALAMLHGHPVDICEPNRAVDSSAISDDIESQLQRMVVKNQISADDKKQMLPQLAVGSDLAELRDCALVIEAVVEDLAIKREVFAKLEGIVSDDCLLATNTSTLSITAIAAALKAPARLVGMHFFNPATRMRLVEVARGLQTDDAAAARAAQWASAWGKTAVLAASAPGFIVNRIARPFYCEALALLEERAAPVADIDAAIVGSGVFPMGAFALIDLIGMDANARNTESLYNAYYQEKRFRPSPLQQDYINGGRLGRKSGGGFYDYVDGKVDETQTRANWHPRQEARPDDVACYSARGMAAALARRGAALARFMPDSDEQRLDIDGIPVFVSNGRLVAEHRCRCGAPCLMIDWTVESDKLNAVAVCASDDCADAHKNTVAAWLQSLGLRVVFIRDTAGMIMQRILSLLINESLFAIGQGVCDEADCDTAMRHGMNMTPPLALARALGYVMVDESLRMLRAQTGEDKFRPSPELQRRAWGERRDAKKGGGV